MFDCAGQGRIDVFFLSGGQIDGEGNINLVSVGDYEHPKVRFPGSFGSAYLYYVVPKVILFRVEHSRRTLVPKVDFISAPGSSPDNVFRPGGPIALDHQPLPVRLRPRPPPFPLASVHPGHTVEEVIENTGFDFDRPTEVPDHGGADTGDAASDAQRRRAPIGRGLSAIRRKDFWRAQSVGRMRPCTHETSSYVRFALKKATELLGGTEMTQCAILTLIQRLPMPRTLVEHHDKKLPRRNFLRVRPRALSLPAASARSAIGSGG